MEIKLVPEKLYFCTENELTIPEIPEFANDVLKPLYNEAESIELEIIGPPEFIYLNSTGEANRSFNLVIAIPVSERKPSNSDYFFLKSKPFDCVSVNYKGSMLNISKAWEDLVQQASNNAYKLSNQCREVYSEWVSFESKENLTELQIGILAQRVI